MALQIRTAPTAPPVTILGRTLPSLLDEAVETYPNAKAFNEAREGGGWDAMSNAAFRDAADEIAAGLHAVGLSRGDHVAFFMNSDRDFALMDMGTLIAGIVNAPLYVTYARENLVYVTQHAEAKAMAVSNPEMLARFADWAGEVPDVRTVILASGEAGATRLPEGVRLVTMAELRRLGRERLDAQPTFADELRDQIEPGDLATLIYTSGTTGMPKGVMLTHENVSSNVWASFPAFGILGHQEEVVVTFLPLTHIFARMLQFAHVAWGHQLHFSDPDRLVGHLAEVRPTVFAAVPRVLEKVYDKVSLGIQQSEGLKKTIGTWALGLASDFETGTAPGGLYALKLRLADKLVFSKLRERLGLTRVKAAVIGGAALRADLSNSFNAFGIPVYQGYGLTETSPVITVELPHATRAGTVGPPIPGIEVAIADDGEILTRGPHVMKGYYKNDEATAECIDAEGWFHTGDIGRFTDEGLLQITDRKKALFKLSTGKYVIPQPIENTLTESALIEQAVVVGNGQKFTTALLFPSIEGLEAWAKQHGVPGAGAALLDEPRVRAEFQRLVDHANRGMDPWSQVKRFHLAAEPMTLENGLLTPKMSVKRTDVHRAYQAEIEKMYADEVPADSRTVEVA